MQHEKSFFVNYATYCSAPNTVLANILQKVDVSAELPELPSFANKRKANQQASENLLSEAEALYQELIALEGSN